LIEVAKEPSRFAKRIELLTRTYSTIFPLAAGDIMKPKNSKLVEFRLDLNNLPPLTESQKAELAVLAALPDDQIDFSDIPDMTEERMKNAIRGAFYRSVKQQITARLDSDVLHWLKSQGKFYQSRMNGILRKEMLAAMKR
jgi:uncharacterized protein (DUF4415 family)